MNLLLGLYICALGILGLIVGGDMFVPLVPVSPASTAMALLMSGLFAVAASLTALFGGRLGRFLLVLWAVALFLALVMAVFRSNYRFEGLESFQFHGLMLAGSLVLLYASWIRFRSASRKDAFH